MFKDGFFQSVFKYRSSNMGLLKSSLKLASFPIPISCRYKGFSTIVPEPSPCDQRNPLRETQLRESSDSTKNRAPLESNRSFSNSSITEMNSTAASLTQTVLRNES